MKEKPKYKGIVLLGNNLNPPVPPEVFDAYKKEGYLCLGNGKRLLTQKEITSALKDNIGSQTYICLYGHGTVNNENHTIDILESFGKTADLLKLIQECAPDTPLVIDIHSCYGGAAAQDVSSLSPGSVIIAHGPKDNLIFGELVNLFLLDSITDLQSIRMEVGKPFQPLKYLADNLLRYAAQMLNVGIAGNNGTKSVQELKLDQRSIFAAKSLSDFVYNIISAGIEKLKSDLGENITDNISSQIEQLKTISFSGEKLERTLGSSLYHLCSKGDESIRKTIDEAVLADKKGNTARLELLKKLFNHTLKLHPRWKNLSESHALDGAIIWGDQEIAIALIESGIVDDDIINERTYIQSHNTSLRQAIDSKDKDLIRQVIERTSIRERLNSKHISHENKSRILANFIAKNVTARSTQQEIVELFQDVLPQPSSLQKTAHNFHQKFFTPAGVAFAAVGTTLGTKFMLNLYAETLKNPDKYDLLFLAVPAIAIAAVIVGEPLFLSQLLSGIYACPEEKYYMCAAIHAVHFDTNDHFKSKINEEFKEQNSTKDDAGSTQKQPDASDLEETKAKALIAIVDALEKAHPGSKKALESYPQIYQSYTTAKLNQSKTIPR